jgi:hypothetical protein
MNLQASLDHYNLCYDNIAYKALSVQILMANSDPGQHTRIMNKIIDVSMALSGLDNPAYVMSGIDLGRLTMSLPDSVSEQIIEYLNRFIDNPVQHGILRTHKTKRNGARQW